MEQKTRYDGLDVLKTISAFLVICAHEPFPGKFGYYLADIVSVAVPCFFMISGFFYPSVIKRGSENKQLLKVFKITLIALACYFVWTWFFYKISDQDFSYIINRLFSFKGSVKMIFFNGAIFGYHLWYMLAFVWVLLIVRIGNLLGLKKLMITAAPFLFLPCIILGRYSDLFLHRFISIEFSRNCYFLGLPSFCIGWYFGENLPRIKEKLNEKLLLLGMLVFGALGPIEHIILEIIGHDMEGDMFFSTPLFVVCTFLYFACFYKKNGVLSAIGRKYSSGIYFVHAAVLEMIYHIFSKTILANAYTYVAPFVIFFLSLGLVWLWKKLTVRKKAA